MFRKASSDILLRKLAVKFVKRNKTKKISVHSDFTFEDIVCASQEDNKDLGNNFNEYIEIMGMNTTWADETIIQATSSLLKAEIKICCLSRGMENPNWNTVSPINPNKQNKFPEIVLGQMNQNHFVGTRKLFVDDTMYW